jgi:hypothetical protein
MIIILTFQNPINESVQTGDIVFAISNFTQAGGFQHNNLNNAREIGHVVAFNNRDGIQSSPIEIHVEQTTSATVNPGDFIMFSKNKAANTSGVSGYYASVKMINDSNKEIELFSVGSDITINSN